MQLKAAAYPDSSFLVSLHRDDAHHILACSLLARMARPLAYTPLHRVEVRNALRNAIARNDMTSSQLRIAFGQIEDDLHDGVLIHTPVEWIEVLRRADALSAQFAANEGPRTIDLLHVAIALESGIGSFLSFDKRQRRLAQAAGLRVKP